MREILYGLIRQDGRAYTVVYAYQHYEDGGDCASELCGYGPDVFRHAAEDGTPHPEAVVVDLRTADRERLFNQLVRGPMPDDGKHQLRRGEIFSFIENRNMPGDAAKADSLDAVNWQDWLELLRACGASVRPWAEMTPPVPEDF